jgi:hypothetical protein
MNIEFSGTPGRRRNVDGSLFRCAFRNNISKVMQITPSYPALSGGLSSQRAELGSTVSGFEDWHPIAIAPKIAGRRGRRKKPEASRFARIPLEQTRRTDQP